MKAHREWWWATNVAAAANCSLDAVYKAAARGEIHGAAHAGGHWYFYDVTGAAEWALEWRRLRTRAVKCAIEECQASPHSRDPGYCDSHHHRWRRYGDPRMGRAKIEPHFEKGRPISTSHGPGVVIAIGKGLHVTVDVEDFEWLSARRWKRLGGYAGRSASGRACYMHRLILNATGEQRVDHINGNPFDNRRANLRFATQQENIHNATGRKVSTSRHKGVSWFSRVGIWQAQITSDGKHRHLGYFKSETAAAAAYNKAALEAFGEYAYLNPGVE